MAALQPAQLQPIIGMLQQGQVAQAEQMLRQLTAMHPGHPDVLHLLAMAAKQKGDAENAERYFRQSLKAAPAQPAVHANYANLLSGLNGREHDAVASYRKAVELEPNFATGWYNLGLMLSETRAHTDALDAAKRHEKLTQGNAASAELFYLIHDRAGDKAVALNALEVGLKREPQNLRLWTLKANHHRGEADFDLAAEAYERARAGGMRDADTYQNLAEAYYELKQLDKAIAVLNEAVSAIPGSGELHYIRAKFLWEAQTGEDHLAALKAAIPQQPDNIGLWGAYFDLLSHQGRYEDIMKGLSEAYRFNIRAPRMSLAEAVTLSSLGQMKEATAVFERLLAHDPRHASPKLAFAEHLIKAGDAERAERLCAEVLADDPGNQKAWTFRGTAWQLLDDERADWLFDFDRMVNPIDVQAPDGYASRDAFFVEVRKELEALHRMQSHPLDQSLRGGTQTNGFLFRLKNPVLKALQIQIRKAVESVVATFPNDPAHPFWGRRSGGIDFSGAWSVRLRSQGYHTNHFHSQGWLSSALYIALPDEVRNGKGTDGHIQFGVPTAEMGLKLPPRRIVKPEVGKLVLFPSYMWHGTIPFSSDEPRMTVAFDVVPTS